MLQSVCKAEKIALPAELAQRITQEANGNVRKALLILEAAKAAQYVACCLVECRPRIPMCVSHAGSR